MKTTPNRAIIIGGSIAGLLTARVLSDHFDYVTVLERDTLPEGVEHRKGVPQAQHLHVLLMSGQRIMEDLFPGFVEDIEAEGAMNATWGIDQYFHTVGGWTQTWDSGLQSHAIGRVALETVVRRRVRALPNVSFVTQVDAKHLVADDGRVVGVRTVSRVDRSEQTHFADLVIDASGRRSNAPEWLQTLGYESPEVTLVNAHVGYATRWYERPENPNFDKKALAIQAQASEELYRGGGIMHVEGNRWVVTLLGANGDYPPTDEEGFMAFAASLATPALYEAIREAKPISSIIGYRKLENQHRHYERLTHMPENFIVLGDAFCAFNPIYGQGMSAAALSAVELGKMIAANGTQNFTGLAAKFHTRLAKLLKPVWLMATAEDARYPLVEGADGGIMERVAQRYFDLVVYVLPHDLTVARAFLEAMNLLKPPTSLMHPSIVWRVVKYHLFAKRSKRETVSPLATGTFRAVTS